MKKMILGINFNLEKEDMYYFSDYGYQLLMFLEKNNYHCLPNYPFKYSLDKMLCYDEDNEDYEEVKEKIQEYAYYCLTHLSEVIEENE